MITVAQALEVLRAHAPRSESEFVSLSNATGRYTAEDIIAKIAMPPFNASNMDGYATCSGDRGQILKVIGESSAGRPFKGILNEGEAVRIFTGAVLPDSADRVVIQENIKRVDDQIELRRSTPVGRHIRLTGSDYSKGQILLNKGRCLSASDVTLAASAGYSELSVRKPVKVAIIETGNELEAAQADLARGQINASNGIGLVALVQDWGASVETSLIALDEPTGMKAALSDCEDADIVVIIGGASVGDYDLATKTAESSGYKIHYAGLALRPGKPGWFATQDQHCILGLPGNPASAFVGAHLFLRPLLGLENRTLPIAITHEIAENGPRETYLRARLKVEAGVLTVTAFPGQDSYRLLPQSGANALIRIPPMGGPYKIGDRLDVIRLTGGPDLW